MSDIQKAATRLYGVNCIKCVCLCMHPKLAMTQRNLNCVRETLWFVRWQASVSYFNWFIFEFILKCVTHSSYTRRRRLLLFARLTRHHRNSHHITSHHHRLMFTVSFQNSPRFCRTFDYYYLSLLFANWVNEWCACALCMRVCMCAIAST